MYLHNIYNLNLLHFSEELFLIVLVFSFFNFVFSILFLELLWPSNFFNFRLSASFKTHNLNNYQSTLIKINSYTVKSPIKFFIKYLN